MIKLLLAAIGLTMATVIIHGLATTSAVVRLSRQWSQDKGLLKRLGAELLIGRLISTLLLFHLAEAGVWAAFFVVADVLPDFETAAYYSLTSYTTVGYGDVVLPGGWRLLGPIEAAVGVLMLGWSTGVLVAALGRVYGHLFNAPPTSGGTQG